LLLMMSLMELDTVVVHCNLITEQIWRTASARNKKGTAIVARLNENDLSIEKERITYLSLAYVVRKR